MVESLSRPSHGRSARRLCDADQRALLGRNHGRHLNGVLSCSADVDGRWAWQWRELGTRAWTSGGGVQVDCPHRVMPLSYRATGLKPDTTYEYRMLVDVGRRCDLNAPSTCRDVASIDGTGRLNGTSWSTMTTQPRCDDVQAAGESLAHFVDLGPRGHAGRPQGALPPRRDPGHRTGERHPRVGDPHAAGRAQRDQADLCADRQHRPRPPRRRARGRRVKGCYGSAGCSGSRDKVVDVTPTTRR